MIDQHIELFNDIDMIDEALTFVYDEKGRPDAESGKHDDVLLSDMIGEEARGQMDKTVILPITKKEDIEPFALRTDNTAYGQNGGFSWN
jgi:hypothetical protein